MAKKNWLDEARKLLTTTTQGVGSFIQKNPTPAGFVNRQFQQRIAQPVAQQSYRTLGNVGKTLQQVPQTPDIVGPSFRGVAPMGPIQQVPGMLTGMLKSYGRTFEDISTPQGRGKLVTSAKKVTKQPLKLENLQEPAVEAAFNIPDFLPGGFVFAGGVKAITRKGVKEIAEKAGKELIEKGAKQSVGEIALQKDILRPRIQQVIDSATKYDKEFRSKVDQIAQVGGKTASHGPVKDFSRSMEKIIGEKGGNVKGLQDWNRSMIPIDSPAEIETFLPKIRELYGEPSRIDSNFIPGNKNYKKIIVNVKTPYGGEAEIQFTTPEMWKAKIQLNGDVMYKKWRTLPEVDSWAYRTLDKKMTALYSEAEVATAKRLNSSSVISLPSSRAITGGNGLPSEVIPRTLEPSSSTLTNLPSTSKNLGKSESIGPPFKSSISPKQPLVNKMNQSTVPQLAAREASSPLKSPQQGFPTTTGQKIPQPVKEVPSGVGGVPKNPSSPPIISPGASDPVQKIIQALKASKPLRNQQEKLYSAERAKRIGKIVGIGKNVKGEKGYYTQLGALKGELPKVEFESIRKQIQQPDIDELFNRVEQNKILLPFEKVNTKTGLAKLLGAEGGTVPTKGEIKLLEEVFGADFVKAVQEKRPFMEKLFAESIDTLNVPRAVMATADFSAPLRQGIFLIGRPKQWIPAFKDQFKYFFSENAYKGLKENIQSRPSYKLMRESKLALTDIGENLASREETFMSTLIEKIPGFGKIAKGSNRAYSGFLNKLRADTFDDILRSAKASGVEINSKFTGDLAKFINSATGRGDLGALQRAAPVLNATLFSPRLVASRLNLLNPMFYAKLNPTVRKEALKSLFGFAGTAITVATLAKLGGADIETDPRNADFMKVKTGNTRYDILGGFQQYIRLAAQLATGKIISSTTGKEITLGEGYKPLTRKDILLRFFESKESPVASFITSLMNGQTGIGEPLNIPREVINRSLPLVWQDMYDLVKEYGLAGIGMGVPGVFGVGSQTYGTQEVKFGTDDFGRAKAQITPKGDIAEDIVNKVFGEKPLGSSAGYNVEAYYKQLKAMPREQAAQVFDKIVKTDPELAKKINNVIKDEQMGVTVRDKTLKAKGVQSGDRARDIAKEFKKLKTQQEKAALWDHYVKTKVITKEVATQLSILLKK